MKISRKNNRKTGNLNVHCFGCFLVLFLTLFTLSCSKPPVVIQTTLPEPEVAEQSAPEPELTQLERWQKLVRENRYASIDQKLVSVNEFFNRFDYIEDRYLWGRNDYWATLTETLNKSGGDCEDFTIAKYFTLLELNIPEKSMRLTYVFCAKNKKPHMVLTLLVDSSQEPLVLDTLNDHLFPVSRRSDLIPVYSFNSEGYWLVKNQKGWKSERLGSAEKLSLWQGVLQRTIEEEATSSGS